MKYFLAIDQGTTGTTALLMDEKIHPIALHSVDFKQYFPAPGQVEHNLKEVWNSVVQAIDGVKRQMENQGILTSQISAIGITNQRETICFWDRKTVEPICHAIVWQDRRTADDCENLKQRGLESLFRDHTGLLLDPYFSGTKVSWALKNLGPVASAARSGRLCIGTIDSFLIAKFSSGTAHVTEPSNASRTLCFHLTKHLWDLELCGLLEVPKDIWPEVRPSTGIFTKTKGFPGLPDGIPISGVLGDQQSALLGQACIQAGSAKCTFGTGAFLLLNTGEKPVKSKHRLLTTIAWALGPSDYTYAIEGSAFVAGAAIQWLRDGLGIIQTASEVEALASKVDNTLGVVFVPALTGLGAPYWDPRATGMITGITRGTEKAHIARATLEGIVFQNVELLQAMELDLGQTIDPIKVDGGGSANQLLMQLQSNYLGKKLSRPKFSETTSLGAIFAAGLGIGHWKSLKEIEQSWQKDCDFVPEIRESTRIEALQKWKSAIARVLYSGP